MPVPVGLNMWERACASSTRHIVRIGVTLAGVFEVTPPMAAVGDGL
jgi:hypothetical protein